MCWEQILLYFTKWTCVMALIGSGCGQWVRLVSQPLGLWFKLLAAAPLLERNALYYLVSRRELKTVEPLWSFTSMYKLLPYWPCILKSKLKFKKWLRKQHIRRHALWPCYMYMYDIQVNSKCVPVSLWFVNLLYSFLYYLFCCFLNFLSSG